MIFCWVLNVRAKANLKCIWLIKKLLKLTFLSCIRKIMTNVLIGKGCTNKEKKRQKKSYAPIFVTKVLPAFPPGKGRYRFQEENWDPIKFHLHGLNGCNSGQRIAQPKPALKKLGWCGKWPLLLNISFTSFFPMSRKMPNFRHWHYNLDLISEAETERFSC